MSNFTPLPAFISLAKNKTSVSSLSKEGEPARFEVQPEVHFSEEEEHGELEKHGVEVRKENIHLPPNLKKLGLTPVGNDKFPQSFQNVHFIISDEKIAKGIHEPITSSIHWLAELGIYMLKKAHIGLRVIGGRVVRVILR